MATVGRLIVKIGTDIGGLDSGLNTAQSKLRTFGANMRNLGAGMTAGVTAPLLGIVAAADAAGTALNRQMGNVQSLGVAADRVRELKGEVQNLGIETGTSTVGMANGLYEVISAFGDTSDTVAILEINAKAAAAGLATVNDAIALTSAVTKGYNDASAEAVQKTADLAFVAVNLGQTTFPELAASIGKVVPLTAALGVSQEELFAVMATATGVTGQASEVSTQLRGVLQSLMAPTATMTALIRQQGYASGAAMLQGEGLGKTILTIVQAAEASNTPLQKYMGSIEGQTLALSLAGPLADLYTDRLDAMGKAAGATDAAFAAQTQGINANGFAAQQAGVKWEVFLQKLGDGLGPAKGAVLDALGPMTDKALEFADKFANLDPNTQKWIVGMAGIVAAAGPVLIVIGSLVTAIAAIGLPMLGVGIGIGILAGVMAANWTTISGATETEVTAMAPHWETFLGWIDRAKGVDFGGMAKGLQQTGAAAATLGGLRTMQMRTQVRSQLSATLDAVSFDLTPVTQRITSELSKVKLGVLLALSTGGGWVDAAAVQGWWEKQTGGIRTELDKLLAGDNVLSRSLATAQGALTTIQATMQGAGGMDGAQRFGAAVGVVTTALSTLGSIKADVLTTAATGITSVATSLLGLATQGVQALDTDQAARLAAMATNVYTPLIDALTNTENLGSLGAAYGKFVTTVANQLGGVLASDAFGTQFGFNVGRSVAQLARGAAALVSGFMDQITMTDLTTFQGQVDTFVQNFVAGVVEGIKSVDWSIVGAAIKDLILFQIQQWLGDKTVAGLIPGPVGMGLNVLAKKMGAPTIGEIIEETRLLDLTRTADILNTELSQVGPAATAATEGLTGMAASPVLGPTAGWPGLDMTFGGTAQTPVIDVVANVVDVQQETPAFPTMMGLLGGAEEAAGGKLAEAANTLNSFSFEWPSLPEWTWPSLPIFNWPSLPSWHWPSIPSPSWLGRLAVPRPEWLGELLSWSPVVRLQTGGPGPNIPLNAMGTSNWQGGYTWVGERGPELVSVPAGARIYNAGESRRMADDEGGIHVTVNVARMNSELDEEALAYRIAKRIQRRA